MATEILPIPDIPADLKHSAAIGNLIPFVGAGVSLLAGCPNWNDFADGALQQLVNMGKVSHAHIAQIKHLNPRVKLSIAKILRNEYELPSDYRSILQRDSKWRDDLKGRSIYESLSKLSNRFVTTNYDEWLDEIIESPSSKPATGDASTPTALPVKRKALYNPIDFTSANLSIPNTVIHLHGSLADEEGMVLTTQDYVRHYLNDRGDADAENENRVITFLEHLFREKSVLFVGYGLEELEILEYVILKARHAKSVGWNNRHYLIQGFFSHETQLMQSMKSYYLNECGIVLLPFLRDINNYEQLIQVLEEYARQIPVSDPIILQEFAEMAGLIND